MHFSNIYFFSEVFKVFPETNLLGHIAFYQKKKKIFKSILLENFVYLRNI